MQYDIQTSRRPQMPVLCPFCGEVVSAMAPTCTVCGFENPGAEQQGVRPCPTCDAKLGPGSKFCRNCGAAVGLTVVPPVDLPEVVIPRPTAPPVVEPELEQEHGSLKYLTYDDFEDELDGLGSSSQVSDSHDYRDSQPGLKAPDPEPEQEHESPKYLTYDDFEDELGGLGSSSQVSDSLDYLDSQLGLKAPDRDPTLRKPPAWRQARGPAPVEAVHHAPPKTADLVAPRQPAPRFSAPRPAPPAPRPSAPHPAPPAPRFPAPHPAPPAPRPSAPHPAPPRTEDLVAPTPPAPVFIDTRGSDGPSLAVQVTVGLALFTLLLAVLIHLVAPSAIPGYSVAELDLKVQVRAIEWLLAGIVFALVGLLLKR